MTTSTGKRSRNNTYSIAFQRSPLCDHSWMMFSTNFKSSPKAKIKKSRSILKNSPKKKSQPPSRSRWNTRKWWICWRGSQILKKKLKPLRRRSGKMNKKCKLKWMRPRARRHKKSKISIISSQVRYVSILKLYAMEWESGGSYVHNSSKLYWKQRQHRQNPQMKIKSMVWMRWLMNIRASIESQQGTSVSPKKKLKSKRHRIQNEHPPLYTYVLVSVYLIFIV